MLVSQSHGEAPRILLLFVVVCSSTNASFFCNDLQESADGPSLVLCLLDNSEVN